MSTQRRIVIKSLHSQPSSEEGAEGLPGMLSELFPRVWGKLNPCINIAHMFQSPPSKPPRCQHKKETSGMSKSKVGFCDAWAKEAMALRPMMMPAFRNGVGTPV